MNGVKSGDSPDFTELLLVDIRLDLFSQTFCEGHNRQFIDSGF